MSIDPNTAITSSLAPIKRVYKTLARSIELTKRLYETIAPSIELTKRLYETITPSIELTKRLYETITPSIELTNRLYETIAPSIEITKRLYETIAPSIEITKRLYETIGPSVEIFRQIKEEIKVASLYLEKYRRINECVNISEEIWNYSKNLLKDIFINISNKKSIGFQVPKFVFIDDSILIRWENWDSKLILSLSDHTSAIAVNLRDKNGQYITGYIHKNEIIDWVTFWLRKLKIF